MSLIEKENCSQTTPRITINKSEECVKNVSFHRTDAGYDSLNEIFKLKSG